MSSGIDYYYDTNFNFSFDWTESGGTEKVDPQPAPPREESLLEKAGRDVIFIILDKLSLRDLLAVGVTCRKMNGYVNDDRFWAPLVAELMMEEKDKPLLGKECEFPVPNSLNNNTKRLAIERLRFFSRSCTGSLQKEQYWQHQVPIPAFLFNERVFVLLRVRYWGACLEELPEEMRKDREVVLVAIKYMPWVLRFADKDLQNDPEIVQAVKNSKARSDIGYAKSKLEHRDIYGGSYITRLGQYYYTYIINTPEALVGSATTVVTAIAFAAIAMRIRS